MELWKATVEWSPNTYWWASLDGENFREVNQDFGADRASEIKRLFNDEGQRTIPMTFTRRYIDHMRMDARIQSVNIEQLV